MCRGLCAFVDRALKARAICASIDCASVSVRLFSDTGADWFLRACLILSTFGHWRSRRTACVSLFACFGTLVQIGFCVIMMVGVLGKIFR